VITNHSAGGLCLAIVGSPRAYTREQIDVKVSHGTFLCNIVKTSTIRLHCRFEFPIDDPDYLKVIPCDPVVAPTGKHPPLIPRQPASSNSEVMTYDNQGRWRAAPGRSGGELAGQTLARIYTQGCLVGREQIDPTLDALDAMVEVLNPYGTADERGYWAQGFKDAVLHIVRQRSLAI